MDSKFHVYVLCHLFFNVFHIFFSFFLYFMFICFVPLTILCLFVVCPPHAERILHPLDYILAYFWMKQKCRKCTVLVINVQLIQFLMNIFSLKCDTIVFISSFSPFTLFWSMRLVIAVMRDALQWRESAASFCLACCTHEHTHTHTAQFPSAAALSVPIRKWP